MAFKGRFARTPAAKKSVRKDRHSKSSQARWSNKTGTRWRRPCLRKKGE